MKNRVRHLQEKEFVIEMHVATDRMLENIHMKEDEIVTFLTSFNDVIILTI